MKEEEKEEEKKTKGQWSKVRIASRKESTGET
jgi:hypothetical protein